MSEKHTEMWRSLGLNLEAHQGLLSVLTDAYQGIYLAQKNRPEGMKYFDFVISEVHGLRIVELVEEKKKGKQIFGTFCLYVPEELILAVDGVSIGLCAGADVGTEEAERYLPRNTWPLCGKAPSELGLHWVTHHSTVSVLDVNTDDAAIIKDIDTPQV